MTLAAFEGSFIQGIMVLLESKPVDMSGGMFCVKICFGGGTLYYLHAYVCFTYIKETVPGHLFFGTMPLYQYSSFC